MIKVTMCTLPELNEVQVNPQDIEIRNGKYYINGIEHSITITGAEVLQIFYLGAQMALDKKITKNQVKEAQAIRL
ncbi:MAG TPA: hypothetical protein P5556_01680 [Candidatus Gastranaerophilales bacterium]|nr:hypothetical protein [Candidatus Gastranaerophilales bacterium]